MVFRWYIEADEFAEIGKMLIFSIKIKKKLEILPK